MKAQSIRLADVFLLGPLMIWAGGEVRKCSPHGKSGLGRRLAGDALALSGLGTILYNGANYLAIRDEEERYEAARRITSR